MSLESSAQFSAISRATDLLVVSRPGRVRYVTLSGAAAVNFVLRDGTTAAGTDIGNFELTAAGNLRTDWPMQFQTGLFIDIVSGAGRLTVVYE